MPMRRGGNRMVHPVSGVQASRAGRLRYRTDGAQAQSAGHGGGHDGGGRVIKLRPTGPAAARAWHRSRCRHRDDPPLKGRVWILSWPSGPSTTGPPPGPLSGYLMGGPGGPASGLSRALAQCHGPPGPPLTVCQCTGSLSVTVHCDAGAQPEWLALAAARRRAGTRDEAGSLAARAPEPETEPARSDFIAPASGGVGYFATPTPTPGPRCTVTQSQCDSESDSDAAAGVASDISKHTFNYS